MENNRQEIINKRKNLENDRRILTLVYLSALAALGTIFIVGVTFVSVATMFFSGFLFFVVLWAFANWNKSWKKEIRELRKKN